VLQILQETVEIVLKGLESVIVLFVNNHRLLLNVALTRGYLVLNAKVGSSLVKVKRVRRDLV
jgi:hypothetical protein